jgi:hypothetical protein
VAQVVGIRFSLADWFDMQRTIWAITAKDYELEGRLKALEVKVRNKCSF